MQEPFVAEKKEVVAAVEQILLFVDFLDLVEYMDGIDDFELKIKISVTK